MINICIKEKSDLWHAWELFNVIILNLTEFVKKFKTY